MTHHPPGTPLFTGPRIRLTAPRSSDAAPIARWYEDTEFQHLFEGAAAYPRTPSAVSRWFEHADRPTNDYLFVLRETAAHVDGDAPIGLVALDEIRWTHGTAWVAIGIGEPAYRGRGYGREALDMLLRFAFTELNLFRVMLTVFSYNTPAIGLYERVGFQHEGTWREALNRGGRRYDILLYGLLAREYRG
jgi:RimJ/RimL family protein N-acetyltransferase